MKLKNKVAVVTGAARGIGFATAKRFCEEGAAVALWDMDAELLQEAARKLQEVARNLAVDVKICCVSVNVSETESVKDAFAQTEKELGSVDILVNNAGITRDAMLHKMSDEQWEAVINVNLKGVFLCGREAAARMREKGSGVILNTSSVVGLYGNIGQTNYAATKAGVIAMTNTWAKELGPKGIRVNAVAPGYTMTEMMQTVPEKVLNAICEKTPLRRLATPEEIAAAFAYLASDEAAFITGHVLSVDGGLVL